jgi:MYXO-CTERM domain-containing protein
MKWSLLAFGLLVAAGCQPGTPTFEGDTFSQGDVAVLRSALATQGDGPNGAHIIFLNFAGQKLTRAQAGQDDPDTGASWILTTSSVQYKAFDASPYAGQFNATQAQTAIVNYFKQFYAPFNVQVVTTRPSGVRYTMCMIGDNASTVLGSGAGSAAGVAPLDCGNQDESEITYAFAAGLSPNQTGLSLSECLKAIAVTAAQETAHSYGLNHTNSTSDIMYPQLDPAQSAFQDATLQLINNSGGTCNNATTQNSKQLLLANIGASNGSMPTGPLPMVSFVAPTNNQTVPMDFTIIVSASESMGTIDHVDISSGSQTLFTWKTPPFRDDVQAPGAGTYDITATAFDSAGNFQASTVTFTASQTAPPQQLPPCKGNSDCPAGQMCNASGACVAASGTTGTSGGTNGTNGGTNGTNGGTNGTNGGTNGTNGGTNGTNGTNGGNGGTSGPGIITGIPTGGDCSNPDGSECMGAYCFQDGDRKYCTNECDPVVTNSCPNGMMCTASSGSHFCTFPPQSHGCSAAPGQPADAPFAFLLLLGVVALRFRRARG